jgi:D-serine deaminase-like pyridoxal phosphate-dependent protein
MHILEVRTPAALVEMGTLERNLALMSRRAHALGVHLRPHVKTHKCIEIAALQMAAGGRGITVSTLAEARTFAEAGFSNITYAVPVAPQRLSEVVALARRPEMQIGILVDSDEVVSEVSRAAEESRLPLGVFLKVDCGYHRAGVDPKTPASRALARRIAGCSWLRFRGLLTHAGHAYHCRSRAEVVVVAEQERAAVVGFATRLRDDGVDVAEVSVGSTPTVSAAAALAGATEVRPGNYAFYDAFQAAIGTCALSECAFSVLTTVIGRHSDPDRLIIDAGALALSKDPGPSHVDPECGFGEVFSPDLQRHYSGLRIVSLSQEHGIVVARGRRNLPSLGIGGKLRIVPNHSCLAAALFDRFAVIQRQRVVAEWHPVRGW